MILILFGTFVFFGNSLADLASGIDAFQNGDFGVALVELRPQAEQGNSEAQSRLAWMYAHGKGVKQDALEAFKWNQLAASQGNNVAQENFGLAYAQGFGVAKDMDTGLKWFRAAAENGNSSAQYRLASMFARGDGAPQNYDEAVKWYRMSIELGNAYAMSDFGWVYQNGFGVVVNKVIAFALYDVSSLYENSPKNKAAINRATLVKGMTASEIENGTKLSCAFLSATSISKKLDEYVLNPEETLKSECYVAPAKLYAGKTLNIQAPRSDGWKLVQTSSSGMSFAKKGALATESYGAQVAFFPLAATSNQDEFIALIKEAIGRETSALRFEIRPDDVKYEYTTERSYPCVRLKYLVRDMSANVGRDSLKALWLEVESLYCRHPAILSNGFAIIFSHRGDGVDAALSTQAQSFIDGVQVPNH